MRADAHLLRSRAESTRKRDDARSQTEKTDARLARSAERVLERRARVPAISVPEDLPIAAYAGEITDLIRRERVIVIAGETGSGKTTQLPKLCLAAGLGVRGMIGHTQPRRLATRAVSARIATELGVELGEEVGFATRFSDQTSEATLVKLMTDGLLLAELSSDRELRRYDAIILDEAHERSLNIDFLLGYFKRLLERRDDLKLIVTSATIDVGAFSQHFAGAPIVEIPGRGYPVTVRYEPRPDLSLEEGVADVLAGLPRGRDVLVFLPGEREIFETARHLGRRESTSWEVLPLYARLSPSEQQKIFKAGGRRRVVLSTNVAETSLTVPNIEFVIDTGVARIARYSFRSKLQRLPVEAISQASAQQRAGRCGRVAPGTCIRLYEEADFTARPAFTEPEIQRSNLAGVALRMRADGLGKLAGFPFLDPPDGRAVSDAERLLAELGAVEAGKLTSIGRQMAKLPVDPRLARMLVAAAGLGALRETLIVVASLAAGDIRIRPQGQRGSADAAHEKFSDEQSDLAAVLKLWRWCDDKREALTNRRFRRELEANFLSHLRYREWRDLHRQLLNACKQSGMRLNQVDAGYDELHQAVLTGCLSSIGQHDEKGRYLGARGMKFRIFPGSGLSEKRPGWLLAISVMETSAVYAHQVARIEPKWLEAAGAHLLKRSHSEPHYSDKRGEVMAFERATLYGLPVIEKRRVRYSPIDADVSRLLFVRDGLLTGAVRADLAFLEANLERVRRLRNLEDKGRRRDLVAADEAIIDFYCERLPDTVVGLSSLRRALRAERELAQTLIMSDADLLLGDDGLPSEDAYPGQLHIGELRFDLHYRFAPGSDEDGITVDVPVGLLPSLSEVHLEWLVPGFLDGLVEALLRGLPKRLRKQLAPLPDHLPDIVERVRRRYRDGRLIPLLTDVLSDRVTVTAQDWSADALPDHFRMRVCVLGSDAKSLGTDRDLAALQQGFSKEQGEAVSDARAEHELDNLEAFPDAGLPERLAIASSGADAATQAVAYPTLTLTDDGSVSYRLVASERERNAQLPDALAVLALKQQGKAHRQMKRLLASEKTLGLHYAGLGTSEMLFTQLSRAAAWQCFFAEADVLPSTAADFEALLTARRGQLLSVYSELLGTAACVLAERFELARALDAATSPAFEATVSEIRAWLHQLVGTDFLTATPGEHLPDLPAYLAGARYRLDHLQGKTEKDRKIADELAAFEKRSEELSAELPHRQVQALRFALEDVRLQAFAQPLAQKLKHKKGTSLVRFARHLEAEERRLGLR